MDRHLEMFISEARFWKKILFDFAHNLCFSAHTSAVSEDNFSDSLTYSHHLTHNPRLDIYSWFARPLFFFVGQKGPSTNCN